MSHEATLRAALAVAGLLVVALAAPAEAHQGHFDTSAWDACDAHALSDACAWGDDTNHRYRGTCRLIGDDLMCVRNQPIIEVDEAEQVPEHGEHEHEHANPAP